MPRQARTLVQLILERDYRPAAHQNRLAGPSLPVKPPHDAPSEAMRRLWDKLRSVQVEFHSTRSAAMRDSLSKQFGAGAREYMDARVHSQMRPEEDVAGLSELLAVNREARRRWEAQNAPIDTSTAPP